MTFANQPKAVEDASPLLTKPFQPSLRPTFVLNSIFVGPSGLRAGWRLLIFLVMLGVPAAVLFAVSRTGAGLPDQITLTPLLLGANDAVIFVILSIVTWIMGMI